MKNRRIGSISMAIVLIGFGILIFIAQINQISAVELSIKFWPGILILLGGEILWHSYKSKDDEVKIKYDIFSIFIVTTILFVNIGIYGLIETDVMTAIKSRISSQTFNYELPFREYDVENTIEKIVIDGAKYSGLTVRTRKNDKISTSGFINITTSSREDAESLLKEDYISVNKSGNIMYITFKEKVDYHYYNLNDLSITIPDNIEIEVNGGNELDLIVDSLENNLIVDNIHRLKVRINEDSNIKVETITNNDSGLQGNVKWSTTEINSGDSTRYTGELVYGDGNNIINILNCYEIVVDGI
ncbi:hypothetical protein [Tissierella sp.]|uniref:hypothetical protein n=1 Tax=Tissierella sp. TaxID=41274 RepID=UPI00285646F8|nr:hypothetical protein [Tissierella sp.]MDR7856832.1 hypothetical protein [Tissierella sp.]